MIMRSVAIGLALLVVCMPAPAQETAAPEATSFVLSYPEGMTDSYTGRVYVMLSRSRRGSPRNGPDWMNTQPFFARDVAEWKPGTPLVIDAQAISFPAPLTKLQERDWTIQGVMRAADNASIGSGPGTIYSKPLRMPLGGASGAIELQLDQREEVEPLPEIDGVEWVELPSELLSNALGRKISHRAAVMPPANYDPEADRTWPTVYVIGGFPGNLRQAGMAKWMWGQTELGNESFIVYLEAESMTGHHVFADSPGNGPRGTALVTEFIPHLESSYPMQSDPDGRLLTGHSSGGWSSLWLQVSWPSFFGGTWSTAPDPVDFRDFQRINIYEEGANAFVDEEGERRPCGREGERTLIWYDDFVAMERVMGDGGQIRSFDWTFSPLGDDGRPRRLIDSVTGAVDPEVAEAWKAYDINLVLQERWEEIGPDLAGKIHVIAGGKDTFFLEGAAEKLAVTLDELGSDAEVIVVPGADHSNFMNRRRMRAIAERMLETARGDGQP